MDNFVNLAQYKHKYSKITKIVDKYYHKKFEDDGDSSRNRRTSRKAPQLKASPTFQPSTTINSNITISDPKKFNSPKSLNIITHNDKIANESKEEEPIDALDLKTLHSKVKS